MGMLEKFRHPHVVRHHASFQTESLTCIVMEYCSDGTLADLIHQQREATAGSGFPQPQALDLWVQVRFPVWRIRRFRRVPAVPSAPARTRLGLRLRLGNPNLGPHLALCLRGWAWECRWCRRWSTCMRGGCCTATSSRPTCSWHRRGASSSATSASRASCPRTRRSPAPSWVRAGIGDAAQSTSHPQLGAPCLTVRLARTRVDGAVCDALVGFSQARRTTWHRRCATASATTHRAMSGESI